MRIHEAGNPDGQTLVLIHGLSSSHRCWDRNLAALGEHHRLRLVELFPRGRRAPAYDLRDAAVELSDMLEPADEPMAVLGHSMGGLIALHLTAMTPALVSRLVLAAPPAAEHPGSLLSRAGGVLRSATRTDRQSIGLVVSTLVAAGPLRMAAAAQATLRADLAAEVAGVATPTLLIWGADDLLVPVETGRRMESAMRDARLVVIPGAAHQAMWDAPAEFDAAVLAFLSAQSSETPSRAPITP
jgi:pimeloyl-ACP methyl ester carboxylesterase